MKFLLLNFESHSNFLDILFQLQESYNLDTSLFAEGSIFYNNQTFDAEYDMTLEDKINVGICATNRGWFDNSVEWFNNAISNIKSSDTKESIKLVKTSLRAAKITHDKILDKKGPIRYGFT